MTDSALADELAAGLCSVTDIQAPRQPARKAARLASGGAGPGGPAKTPFDSEGARLNYMAESVEQPANAVPRESQVAASADRFANVGGDLSSLAYMTAIVEPPSAAGPARGDTPSVGSGVSAGGGRTPFGGYPDETAARLGADPFVTEGTPHAGRSLLHALPTAILAREDWDSTVSVPDWMHQMQGWV
eukprot:gene11501-biopygen197